MSNAKQSRFTPQNPHWYADLPERAAPDIDRPAIFADLNHIDETYLEISRASALLRGVMIFFSILPFAGAIFSASLFYSDIPSVIREGGVFGVLLLFLIPGLIPLGIFALRLDLATPRDEPVRFNRKRGKVYLSEFKRTWNPFGHWSAVVKEFDWNTLQAEVTKQAGFNGKIYMERYALFLVNVKPGTNEVLDRFQLVGNNPFGNSFPALWAYLKNYMGGGTIVKPETPIRNQEVRFVHSMDEWLPTYEITQRKGYNGEIIKHSLGEAFFLLVLNLLLTPAWPALFLIAVGHYIAMRFAPAAIWPPTMDSESKSGAI